MARETRSTVRIELLDEAAALSPGITIITEARAARFDRLTQDADDRIAKEPRFLE
jgi:hypothetical protein